MLCTQRGNAKRPSKPKNYFLYKSLLHTTNTGCKSCTEVLWLGSWMYNNKSYRFPTPVVTFVNQCHHFMFLLHLPQHMDVSVKVATAEEFILIHVKTNVQVLRIEYTCIYMIINQPLPSNGRDAYPLIASGNYWSNLGFVHKVPIRAWWSERESVKCGLPHIFTHNHQWESNPKPFDLEANVPSTKLHAPTQWTMVSFPRVTKWLWNLDNDDLDNWDWLSFCLLLPCISIQCFANTTDFCVFVTLADSVSTMMSQWRSLSTFPVSANIQHWQWGPQQTRMSYLTLS